MQLRFLYVCILSALCVSHIAVVTEERQDQADEIKTPDTITVVASRTELELDQVLASVSVAIRKKIDQYLIKDIKDLVRYEHSVKTVTAIDNAGTCVFTPPGYDAFACFKLAKNLVLRLDVFNAGNHRYWDWADVYGVATIRSILHRYTRQGNSISASVLLDW